MKITISPEFWNTLSRVQKRVLAEGVQTDEIQPRVDAANLVAWGSTIAAAAALVLFTIGVLR